MTDNNPNVARAAELDAARRDYRAAKERADAALREYLRLNAIAYDLKVKIRPKHWPESVP